MLAIHRLVIPMSAIPTLTIPRLTIYMLAIILLVVPSLEKSNKLKVLLFTNVFGR